MSAVSSALAAEDARQSRDVPTYAIETVTDWAGIAAQWDGGLTPFQHPAWLASWYGALGERPELTPLLLTARDGVSGEVALRLPLVLYRKGRMRIIEFADLEITDFNAPAVGPAAPGDARQALALWRKIRTALPPADLVRLRKMPGVLRGRPNPLALLPQALPCAENGNLVVTGDDWDAWRRERPKTVRKELERSWRVFSREPNTSFEIVTDPERAQAVLRAMEWQQQTRMREKGVGYTLDDPEIARFYRDLVRRGTESGFAVLSALLAGDEVVASLLGVRDGPGFVMIRISNAGGPWANCSPGRLIIERTMAELHAQGCRSFDFSIGNYDYKRRLGVTPVPLYDYTEALSLVGIPHSLRARAAGELRKRPELNGKLRGVLQRFSNVRA